MNLIISLVMGKFVGVRKRVLQVNFDQEVVVLHLS